MTNETLLQAIREFNAAANSAAKQYGRQYVTYSEDVAYWTAKGITTADHFHGYADEEHESALYAEDTAA